MEVYLHWARGPLFVAALTFMILGLARHVAIALWEMVRVWFRAGDKDIPFRQVLVTTRSWLFPVDRLQNRRLVSLLTVTFHASIILVPLLLAGHIALWKGSLGISWPALPNWLSTVLTVLAIVTGLAIVVVRLFMPDTRALSRVGDYALPLVILVPFVSGFLVMHPSWNPFTFEATLLVHALSADVLLVLIPLTKLSHIVLLPATQLVSELAWHFPATGGSRVAVALGKENEPI